MGSTNHRTTLLCLSFLLAASPATPLGLPGSRSPWDTAIDPPCEDFYIVKAGESLQTISAKCNDPFILEENPYIIDDHDVYAGLVLKITTPPRNAGGNPWWL